MKENLRSFSFRSLSNKSIKSIANYRNRSKSKITKTRVIDFYRFPILIDWLVSITIDYVRFLSSIENIDLLRPVYCSTQSLFLCFFFVFCFFPLLLLLLLFLFSLSLLGYLPAISLLSSFFLLKDSTQRMSGKGSAPGQKHPRSVVLCPWRFTTLEEPWCRCILFLAIPGYSHSSSHSICSSPTSFFPLMKIRQFLS